MAELEDLEAELEAEEQETLDKELLDVGPVTGLPEVPGGDLTSVRAKTPTKNKEEDEMAELAAWAS